MVERCLRKFGKEIHTTRVGLVFRETVSLDLLDLACALIRSSLRKERYWEDGVAEADALREKADRVLLEEEIQDRNLADLYNDEYK